MRLAFEKQKREDVSYHKGGFELDSDILKDCFGLFFDLPFLLTVCGKRIWQTNTLWFYSRHVC